MAPIPTSENNKEEIKKNRYLHLLVILLMLASLIFLAYKIATYPDYSTLLNELKSIHSKNLFWLFITLFLLPFNWITESLKWKIIVSETEKISLNTAFKSVLAGFSTGFVTPNRLGDFAGRILFLNNTNRKTGFTLSMINSITQNIAIGICGIPAAIIFFTNRNTEKIISLNYFFLLILLILMLIILYAALPFISEKLKKGKTGSFLNGINNYTFWKQISIILMSILRFTVFSIQFYTILLFFGVQLSLSEAIIAIPASYLFVTFTPSAAFSDPVIRSSYAVFFIGAYSPETINIIFAGTGIWIVNYLISMFIGNIFIFNKTRENHS